MTIRLLLAKFVQVEHPAAKMMILSSQMQEEEVGDGTNFVIIFAGALLTNAIPLLKMVTFFKKS